MSDQDEKIKLHAVYRKNGAVTVHDQHGRSFDAEMDIGGFKRLDQESTLIELTMVAPHFPLDKPKVEVKITVPLEVEERLPGWMQEHLNR